MNETNHYGENIFFLTIQVRMLEDSFKLKTDPALFSEKIAEDIFFVDKTIQKIYSQLKENTHLIKRYEYLHGLVKLKSNFSQVINGFMKQDPKRHPEVETFSPQLKRALESHEQDIIDIRSILKNRSDTLSQSDILSYDELNYLMTPVEGEE